MLELLMLVNSKRPVTVRFCVDDGHFHLRVECDGLSVERRVNLIALFSAKCGEVAVIDSGLSEAARFLRESGVGPDPRSFP